MDWKEIQKVDRYIRETEDYLLNHTPWDGIRDWNFYMEVESRMNKSSSKQSREGTQPLPDLNQVP